MILSSVGNESSRLSGIGALETARQLSRLSVTTSLRVDGCCELELLLLFVWCWILIFRDKIQW